MKPQSRLNLRPNKRTTSEIPLGLGHGKIPAGGTTTTGRVQGLISAVAGLSNIAQPPAGTSELLASASSFVTGIWGSSAGTSSSSPKKLS